VAVTLFSIESEKLLVKEFRNEDQVRLDIADPVSRFTDHALAPHPV
jgi:hypothetical protein